MKITKTIVISSSAGMNTAKISFEKSCASSWPPAARRRLNSGTNPDEKAPSANSRRKMLGSRKARLNASFAWLAPSTREPIMSRAKPSTRLTMVRPPIVPTALIRFIFARSSNGPGSGLAGHVSGLASQGFRLLLSRALHVESREIDGIEPKRREARLHRRVGDQLADEREQEPRSLGEQEGAELI